MLLIVFVQNASNKFAVHKMTSMSWYVCHVDGVADRSFVKRQKTAEEACIGRTAGYGGFY